MKGPQTPRCGRGKAVPRPSVAALLPGLGWRCSDGYGVPCKELNPIEHEFGLPPLGSQLARFQHPYLFVPSRVSAAGLHGDATSLQSSHACRKGKWVRSPFPASRRAVDEISFPFFSLHQLLGWLFFFFFLFPHRLVFSSWLCGIFFVYLSRTPLFRKKTHPPNPKYTTLERLKDQDLCHLKE